MARITQFKLIKAETLIECFVVRPRKSITNPIPCQEISLRLLKHGNRRNLINADEAKRHKLVICRKTLLKKL